jgi:hypothetical protein
MKTILLLVSALLCGMTTVSAEQPELSSLTTQMSHWTLAESDQPKPEPLYDFPISRSLGIEIDSTPTQPADRVPNTRIFSFYIAAQ